MPIVVVTVCLIVAMIISQQRDEVNDVLSWDQGDTCAELWEDVA